MILGTHHASRYYWQNTIINYASSDKPFHDALEKDGRERLVINSSESI